MKKLTLATVLSLAGALLFSSVAVAPAAPDVTNVTPVSTPKPIVAPTRMANTGAVSNPVPVATPTPTPAPTLVQNVAPVSTPVPVAPAPVSTPAPAVVYACGQ